MPPNFTLLQVIPELETGGAEQTTIDIARAVVEAGGRALVAARGGRMLDELAAAGGEFVALPMQTKNPFGLAANARRLERLVREEGVSLVHARSRAPAFSALAAARRAGAPFVATYHGVYNARSPLKRWYNGVMTRGDLVIANSDYTREHLLREHGTDPAKVVTVPRGVDLRRFDPDAIAPERVAAVRASWGLAPDEPRPVFLLAGRLTRWKGQAFIVEAMQRAFPPDGGRWPEGPDGGGVRAANERHQGLPSSPSATPPPSDPAPPDPLPPSRGKGGVLLILAGDDQGRGEYRATLQRLAAPFDDAVRIVGHVADMPAAYLAADVALAPSLEPEAFGRTAVEPQAMGRPVLAAAHGATAETVDDGVTGRLIRPGDQAAWAAALADAASWSPERRAAMGAAGRERVRRLFSLERMCADTLAAYARVLEARR